MFTVTLANEKCKIKITSAKDGTALGSVTGVKIKRRELGDTPWTLIYTKSVASINDFDYTFLDKYTRSRRTYEYRVIPMIGSTEGTAVEASIECNFDEIYISDSTAEYILFANAEYDFDSNQDVTYHRMLNSKYPVRVQNGLTDYDSGYVDAIPLPLDASGNPTSVGAQKYKEIFMRFLKNGLTKYLKTNEGEAWLVAIDANPKRNKAEAEGTESVRFSWTEIGGEPVSDIV